MNSDIFNHLKDSLTKTTNPENQMYLITRTIGNVGTISRTQIADLMKYLPSDYYKLQLSKMAYGYVNDFHSYDHIVGDSFSFHHTKDYLNEYVHRY
ncbi:unnamed protein product [Adineta ricciae]|uniref:DUF4476 domain-containing protein n=1 Tax=Adineta ricciae TaxID=249248 RepID=A0A815JGJ0_ADIRI|nr:unnamed protein product [Adineta ricciae]CAF1383979.1 unnamed protein product [Adineta ricciae]